MAAEQTIQGVKPAKKRGAGWKQLSRLMPYLMNYKGGMTIGLILSLIHI